MSSDVRLQQRAAPVGRVLWCDPLRRGPPGPQDPSHHGSPTLVDEVANHLTDLLANRSALIRVSQFSPGKASSARIEYRADTALYHSKQSGRNRITCEPDWRQHIVPRSRREDDPKLDDSDGVGTES